MPFAMRCWLTVWLAEPTGLPGTFVSARLLRLSSVIQRVLALPRRSRSFTIGWFLLKNLVARHSSIDIGGTQSKGVAPREAAAYSSSAFDAIVDDAGLAAEDLRGRRLLELGPGDNVGLALRFLAAGAAQAVCLDRFEIKRDIERERRIYECILNSMRRVERERLESAVQVEPELRFNSDRLRTVTGVGIEEAAQALGGGSFDFIVSVAVLEHVLDLDRAFAAMDELLVPGGLMVHQVDFRDHGMFTMAGKHPLTFLTVPSRLWLAMTQDVGGPNRRLLNFYREKLADLGYESRLMVTDLLGQPTSVKEPSDALSYEAPVADDTRALIARIRPYLDGGFRHLPDADLAVAGALLVAHKPA